MVMVNDRFDRASRASRAAHMLHMENSNLYTYDWIQFLDLSFCNQIRLTCAAWDSKHSVSHYEDTLSA